MIKVHQELSPFRIDNEESYQAISDESLLHNSDRDGFEDE
jgi:hypothetical protein